MTYNLYARLAAASLALCATSAALANDFTDISAGLTGVHHGAAVWGDYNGDGQLDLLATGQTTAGPFYSEIYRNSAGAFTPISAGFPGVASPSGRNRSAWGDFDNDGDLDVVVTGSLPNGYLITNLYRNNNDGTFSLMSISPSAFPGVELSAVAWGDFDNDGDLDLFIEGYVGGYLENVTTVFRNDGPNGSGGWIFTDISPGFTRVSQGDGAWADYDNDGDLDLIVTGYQTYYGGPSTTLYRNDGGVFIKVSTANLPNVAQSSVAWGDYDNDGYLDLAVAAGDCLDMRCNTMSILRVYRNNHAGSFTQAWSALETFENGSLAWGDYDNDGKLDLLVTGLAGHSYPEPVSSVVYRGNGAGTFAELMSAGLAGADESQAVWGDYDNDGRLDILLAGKQATLTSPRPSMTSIYRNQAGGPANTLPQAPTGVRAMNVTWKSITVTWNPSVDAESPQATLDYNLWVRDQITGKLVVSPMANTATGKRWLPQLGNVNKNTTWTITGLTPGRAYFVCVQAIDQAFAGSPFTCSPIIVTPVQGPDVMIKDCAADRGAEPNPACSVYYQSPSIYVRNQPDGLSHSEPQSPISGQINWVYVKLDNISSSALSDGQVYVYFAKASTGLSWSKDWINNYIGGIPYGDLIGSAAVHALPALGSTIVEIPWVNVPDPSDYHDADAHHFCLAARFVSPADPMKFPEGSSHPDNTRNNNNIAWRNVSIIDSDGPRGPVELHNPRGTAVPVTVRAFVPPEEAKDPILQHAQIKLDLGTALYQMWRQAGQPGFGVRPVSDDEKNTAVWIQALSAEIRGLKLEADERVTLRVEVVYPAFDPKVAGKVYHWNLEQYEGEGEKAPLTGGEGYDIHMPEKPQTPPVGSPTMQR